MVYKLKRSLCNTAWSNHLVLWWYDTINADMLIVGFTPTQTDPCVYTPGSGDNFVILSVHDTGTYRHLDRRTGLERGEVPEEGPHGSLRNDGYGRGQSHPRIDLSHATTTTELSSRSRVTVLQMPFTGYPCRAAFMCWISYRPVFTFTVHGGLNIPVFAGMLDSLVRVSRRGKENHVVRAGHKWRRHAAAFTL